jgi:hypothetical protein
MKKGDDMKATIEVKDKKEAEAIRSGLVDPSVRAFVVILGVLNTLTPRQQARVMTYVQDRLQDEATSGGGGNCGTVTKEVKL